MEDYPRNVRDTFSIIPESDEITRDVFHTNLAAMLITSFRSGRIIDANDVFFDTFGLHRAHTIGQTAMELNLISEADRDEAIRILEGGGVIRGVERKYRRPDGSHLYVSWTAELVRIKNKECLFSVFLDITQQKNTQQELKESKMKIELANMELEKAMEIKNQYALKAEEASKAKSAFLANTSHEIRTPMNAIVGYTEMLLDDDITAEQRHALKMIEYSAENLLSLLDNILDLSKIEANKLVFEQVSFNVEKLVFQTMHLIHIKAANDNVEMLADTSGITTEVIGDPMRLRQVLTNLLSNAAKFTSDGYIFVQAREIGCIGNRVNIEFVVQDTGIGVEDDKIQKIFQPFVQADGSITRQYGGTGLGLAICKNLVSLMDGTIRVKSKKHHGSTFTFDVWLDRRPTSSQPQSPVDNVQDYVGKTVLIAEDNEISASILETMLSDLHIEIIKVKTLDAALETIHARHVDFALVDAMLPQNDTQSIPERLQNASMNQAVQILGISHVCNPNKQAKTGYAGFLTKPLDKKRLLTTIQRLFGFSRHQHTPFAGASVSAAPFTSAQILVAEDHEVNQQLMITMIERMGHVVHIASDGIQALQMARTELFDLILMDMQMPGLSGLEVTKKIRETGNKVPIVALTASAMKGDMDLCLYHGMNDYITKPIKRDLLQKVLYKHLGIGAREEVRSKIRALMLSTDEDCAQTVKNNLQRSFPTASFRHVKSELEGMVSIGSLHPHILFVDLATVRMDIMKLLDFLQQDDHYSNTSVIAIVEPAQNLAAVNQLFAFSNVEILSKPINRTDLTEALSQLVSGNVPLVSYVPEPFIERMASEAASIADLPIEEDDRDAATNALSLKKIAKEMMLEIKDYHYLLDQYIETNQKLLEKMKYDFSVQDTTELARKAHAIRGSSANLFLKEMALKCSKLEDAIRMGNMDDARQIYENATKIFKLIIELRNKS
ncbi:MAG: response regulator [Deltaproteobacteria bacterium]|nr:response regulator [Deltaproteobacteria bacterium]